MTSSSGTSDQMTGFAIVVEASAGSAVNGTAAPAARQQARAVSAAKRRFFLMIKLLSVTAV